MLVTACEDELYQDIPLSRLPQSFLDAVVITWRLGYRYLWIDALCIVQDSEDDWSNQVPQLGNIYRGAAITIAALKASHSGEGCFTSRNPLANSGCRISDDDSGQAWSAHPEMDDTSALPGPWERSANGKATPLLRRAWAVQERAFAPRTIYFGSEMVNWECLQCTASEMSPSMADAWIFHGHIAPDGIDGAIRERERERRNKNLTEWFANYDSREGNVKSNLANFLSYCEDASYEIWKHYWWDLVAKYSCCDLSKDTDKFAAFAAIVREAEKRSGTSLIQGLWPQSLEDELLWACHRGRRLQIDVPTWSWLSVSGNIDRYSDHEMRKTKCTAAVAQTHESFTSSKSMTIAVTAPFMAIKFIQAEFVEYRHELERQSGIRVCWENDPGAKAEGDAHILQFRTKARGMKTRCRTFYGLVVVPIDVAKARWQRVGRYTSTITGPEAWSYGHEPGERKRITLV